VTGCSCNEGMLSTSMPSKLRTEGPKPCKTAHTKYTIEKLTKIEETNNAIQELSVKIAVRVHNLLYLYTAPRCKKYANHAIERLFNYTQIHKYTKAQNTQTHKHTL